MYLLHLISLIVIAVTWLAAWRVGCRWCRGCGVDERTGMWAIGAIFPIAGLVFAVHVTALAALITGRGLVAPEPVALIFLLMTWVGNTVTAKRNAPGANSITSSTRSSTLRGPEHSSFLRGEPRALARAVSPPSGELRQAQRSCAHPKTALGLVWLPVLVIVGLYAVFFLDAATRYPTGYDGLHYHLPMAVSWMQSGSIDLVVGQMHRSLPDNAVMVPTLLAFGGLERLFTLINVPNALLLAVAVYGLTKAIGVAGTGAVAAGCVALSIPIIVFQSFSSYIDLYALVMWLLSLLALTWAARAPDDRRRRDLLLLAGLSAGVALGCKTTFLILVPLFGLVAIFIGWAGPRSTARVPLKPVQNAIWFALAALVCSGFWFIRGTVQAGNPIYPLGITVAGKEILPGQTAADHFPRRPLVTKIRRWWHYPWVETRYTGTGEYYSVNNGLGAAYAMLVPLGILAAAGSVLRRRPRDPTDKWKLIFVVLTLTGPVLLLTVFYEVPRYILPQLVLAVPLAAVLLDRLMAKFPRSAVTLLTLALATTATISSVSPLRALAGRVRDDTWSRAAFYEIPELIDDFEPGTRILNLAPPPLTYPLLGRNLTNEVISGPHWAALLDGKTISTQTLRQHQIDYIYVRRPWPENWPDDLPVEMIYDDTETRLRTTTPATRVYRVTLDE